jgi:PAS domain S-box-containing protein
LDPTPIAFLVSGVAYLGALTRFRLLGTNPSPNRRARRLVFERMQEAAIVVDSHDYIVDMNESAEEILGVTPREALGSRATEIVPRYEELPADGSVSGHLTVRRENTEAPYDATVTRISDFHGRTVGRVITFHDISEHIRQQQRLEVLNRVLRHNIRTETNLIHGYAGLLRETDEAKNAEIVRKHAMNIADIGEKAREISDIFEQKHEPTEPARLDDILAESVALVRETYPDVDVTCEWGPDDIYIATVLRSVFKNVVENAAEHNQGPAQHVWIEAERTEDRVRVVVSDDGPGIDEYERAVLERGTESPLEHGSGLGLWLVTWGTGIAGGSVSFSEREPTGSVVTIEVPVLTPPDSSRPELDSPS